MTRARSVATAALCCVVLAGCASTWRQVHGDASNTGTLIVGTKPAAMGTAQAAAFPLVGHASPVISPQGFVYLASWERGTGGAGDLGHGAMWRLAGSGAPLIMGNSGDLPGQLSTAAVDADGNVYAAQYLTFGHGVPQSALLKWDPALATRKTARINGVALSAPKILDGTGQPPLVVQTYTTDIGAHHVLILNDQLTPLADWETCVPDQPSLWDNFKLGFHVQGIDLGPPYFESASVGIRGIDGNRGKTYYLVAASDGCGVTFYTIDPTLANPKVMTFIAHAGPNSAMMTSPAISADGIAVIAANSSHGTMRSANAACISEEGVATVAPTHSPAASTQAPALGATVRTRMSDLSSPSVSERIELPRESPSRIDGQVSMESSAAISAMGRFVATARLPERGDPSGPTSWRPRRPGGSSVSRIRTE